MEDEGVALLIGAKGDVRQHPGCFHFELWVLIPGAKLGDDGDNLAVDDMLCELLILAGCKQFSEVDDAVVKGVNIFSEQAGDDLTD